MRMGRRSIGRQEVLASVDNYEIIVTNLEDKYLPSYLVWMRHGDSVIHVLFATDVEAGVVRVVTAYRPALSEWTTDMKRRLKR